jgi:hypothetical protein
LVTATAAGMKNVQLLDEDGLPTQAHLGVDVGVVITAWRPRRMATPRYRVRSAEGVEGWVDATNLRRIPPPPPPPSPVAPVVAPKPVPQAKSVVRKPAPPAKPKPAARAHPTPTKKPAARAKAPVKKKPKPAPRRTKKRRR